MVRGSVATPLHLSRALLMRQGPLRGGPFPPVPTLSIALHMSANTCVQPLVRTGPLNKRVPPASRVDPRTEPTRIAERSLI